MSDPAPHVPASPVGFLIFLGIYLGLILVAVANVHLVYVAQTSQPGCVEHRRLGEAHSPTLYPAAQSSCRISNPSPSLGE